LGLTKISPSQVGRGIQRRKFRLSLPELQGLHEFVKKRNELTVYLKHSRIRENAKKEEEPERNKVDAGIVKRKRGPRGGSLENSRGQAGTSETGYEAETDKKVHFKEYKCSLNGGLNDHLNNSAEKRGKRSPLGRLG